MALRCSCISQVRCQNLIVNKWKAAIIYEATQTSLYFHQKLISFFSWEYGSLLDLEVLAHEHVLSREKANRFVTEESL